MYYLKIANHISLEPYRYEVAQRKAEALKKTLNMEIEIIPKDKVERKGKEK